MSGFQVFTSYAQADREKHLDKFVEEFREEVGSLLGLVDRTAVVFFDRDGVKAGDAWSPTIIEALRNTKVLVCLMSPTYLGRGSWHPSNSDAEGVCDHWEAHYFGAATSRTGSEDDDLCSLTTLGESPANDWDNGDHRVEWMVMEADRFDRGHGLLATPTALGDNTDPEFGNCLPPLALGELAHVR